MTKREINKIIIHCSATRESQDVSIDTIRKWHLDRGWRDVGYHIYFRKNGEIEHGRPLEQIGAHAKGHNRDSIGVCYEGGLDNEGKPKDTRTKLQVAVMVHTLYKLWVQHGKPEIIGHNEISKKQCPCFDVKKWVESLKWE